MQLTTTAIQVVIVDDQEAFRSAARLVVQLTDGFEVVGEAATAEDGIVLIDQIRPQLVLMDINMPGIDGLEATRRLSEAHPGIKVIIFSTYEPNEYQSRALDAGAIAFVPKADFEPSVLVETWSNSNGN